MSRSNIARPMDGGGVFGSSGRDGDMPECGDFKRGACFRATCKFMHNGRPASEQPPPGVPGSNNAGAAGLPTPSTTPELYRIGCILSYERIWRKRALALLNAKQWWQE